jgi:serine/threonine-protein phosphatase 2A activator
MYNAEVLSKFPVVQHFPFGSLFRWEEDPDAPPQPVSVHTSSQPKSTQLPSVTPVGGSISSRAPQAPTQAPWAGTSTRAPPSTTAAPWARNPAGGIPTAAPVPNATAAPWARPSATPAANARVPGMTARPGASIPAPTGAPWAKPQDDKTSGNS